MKGSRASAHQPSAVQLVPVLRKTCMAPSGHGDGVAPPVRHQRPQVMLVYTCRLRKALPQQEMRKTMNPSTRRAVLWLSAYLILYTVLKAQDQTAQTTLALKEVSAGRVVVHPFGVEVSGLCKGVGQAKQPQDLMGHTSFQNCRGQTGWGWDSCLSRADTQSFRNPSF